MLNDIVRKLKVPKATAEHLLALLDIEEERKRGKPIFAFPDERLMRAAGRRGLTTYVENEGWYLTDLCREWAKQYRRQHLRVIEGGASDAASPPGVQADQGAPADARPQP